MEPIKTSEVYIYNLYRDVEFLNDSFAKLQEMNAYIVSLGALSPQDVKEFISFVSRFLQNASLVKLKLNAISEDFEKVKRNITNINDKYVRFYNKMYSGRGKLSIDYTIMKEAEEFVELVNKSFYSGIRKDIGRIADTLLKGR